MLEINLLYEIIFSDKSTKINEARIEKMNLRFNLLSKL